MQQYILDFQVSLDAVRAEWPHMFPDPPPPPGVDLHQLGGLLILLLALGSIFYIHSTLAAQAQEIKPFQETFTRLDAQISELSHGVDSLLPPELLIHRAELAKVCQYWQTFASSALWISNSGGRRESTPWLSSEIWASSLVKVS